MDKGRVPKRLANTKNMGSLFAGAFVIQFITNYTFAVLLQALRVESLEGVWKLGLFLWTGFVGTILFNTVLWEGHKVQFYLINASNRLATIMLGGTIYYLMSS